jgi:hypothetical protein
MPLYAAAHSGPRAGAQAPNNQEPPNGDIDRQQYQRQQ